MNDEENNNLTASVDDQQKTFKEYIKEHKVPFIIFTSIFSICLIVVIIFLIISLSKGPNDHSPTIEAVLKIIKRYIN